MNAAARLETALDHGEAYPYDPTQVDIDIRQRHSSIYGLNDKVTSGNLILERNFGTDHRWTDDQKSRFIESLILNFPVPPFYAQETREGKWIIMDGLKRANTIREFFGNDLKLQGLKALSHLNGKTFDDLKSLPGAYQTKIEDRDVIVYVLRPSIQPVVIHDMYNRVHGF